ncbi:BTB/POZ domain-containing protein [Ditylenchus destructor]|uniref:BTB/POZ domain-containing protein n=1 Tax=Ditylenchus destructor TaxID=166010 RepID=A0AAD4MUD0_9BILA|nr:BTB/POZ domain-containing protein [Ditylenchus destructor]
MKRSIKVPRSPKSPSPSNLGEVTKFSMTIENIKGFTHKQKPSFFRIRRSEPQTIGLHECRLIVQAPDAVSLQLQLDYGIPFDPFISTDAVVAVIRLRSGTGMPDKMIKMLSGTRTLGTLEEILDPVNGYTKDNILHLEVEMSLFIPNPTNRISLTIPNAKEWLSGKADPESPVVSSAIQLGNAKWTMSAKIGTDKVNNLSTVSVFAHCNPIVDTCAEWSCVASRTFVLKAHSKKRMDHAMTSENCWYPEIEGSESHGIVDFINEKDLFDPSNAYITPDGSAEFYAYITCSQPLVKKIDEYAAKLYSQLDTEMELNGTLTFSKRKLRLLAAYSPFFEALFFTRIEDFKERNMKQIPIDQVPLENFKLLLSVIYPNYAAITDDNVLCLLELADRFQMDFVTKQCEKHLVTKSELPFRTKIAAADVFRLHSLMNECLANVESAETLLALYERRRFMQRLSTETQLRIRQEIIGNWSRSNSPRHLKSCIKSPSVSPQTRNVRFSF